MPWPIAIGDGDDAVDAEVVQGGGDADDVDDRVERADLVELDVGRVDAVHRALGARRACRRSAGRVARTGSGRSAASSRAVIAFAGRCSCRASSWSSCVVVVVGVGDDVGPRRRDAAALHPLEPQRVAVDAEARQRGEHGVLVGAGVDERAEQHVAGDAGRALT